MAGDECVKGAFIGRGNQCRVRIKDDSLSKEHANLKYSPTSGWILSDGDLKKSTNGTWLYANEEFELYNQMFFKSGQFVFQVFLNKN